jgi:hypothetical protein
VLTIVDILSRFSPARQLRLVFSAAPVSWRYWKGSAIKLDSYFALSGKPTGKAFIKAFNGRFRQECLNGL